MITAHGLARAFAGSAVAATVAAVLLAVPAGAVLQAAPAGSQITTDDSAGGAAFLKKFDGLSMEADSVAVALSTPGNFRLEIAGLPG